MNAGEGIEVVGNQILMLTWQSSRGLIYDVDSFKRSQIMQLNIPLDELCDEHARTHTHIHTSCRQAEFPIRTTTGEGWGIAYDPKNRLLVVSDGSPFLHFWDPDALPAVRQANTRRSCIHRK